MKLEKAIEILKVEQGVAALDLSNDRGNLHTQEFVDALNVVFEFIYDVLQIIKIGK